MMSAAQSAQRIGAAEGPGEEVAALRALPLHHAEQRLPRLRVDGARGCLHLLGLRRLLRHVMLARVSAPISSHPRRRPSVGQMTQAPLLCGAAYAAGTHLQALKKRLPKTATILDGAPISSLDRHTGRQPRSILEAGPLGPLSLFCAGRLAILSSCPARESMRG